MTGNDILGRDIQDWERLVRSGIAGGIAGCVAKTTVAPLDRVKILFQTSHPEFMKYSGSFSGMVKSMALIYKDNGARGLLQGHSATLLRIFPYAGLKFMAYDQMHHYLMPTRARETNLKRFTAGASSGVIAVLLTYPLEIIRVRLAVETRVSSDGCRPSLAHAITRLYHEGTLPKPEPGSKMKHKTANSVFRIFPILKFYRGFSATILGMIPYAGTSFLVWGSLRSYYLPKPAVPSADGRIRELKPKLHPMLDLVVGGISGAVAQTVSYPLEVVRRRMQVGGLTRPDAWMGWNETVRAIWRKNGWRGFFVGLGIGYIKVVPMTAVSYMVWELGKSALGI